MQLTDDVEVLGSVLNTLQEKTGKMLTCEDFQDRLTIQKVVYLLSQMGYSPVERFRFDNYIRGPHSTGLATAYYKLSKVSVDHRAVIPDAILMRIVECMDKGTHFMEAVATLDIVSRSNPRASQEEVTSFVQKRKPFLINVVPEAWQYLREKVRCAAI